MLVFRTPPYIVSEITLQDALKKIQPPIKTNESPRLIPGEKGNNNGGDGQNESNRSSVERKKNRRFSSTSVKYVFILCHNQILKNTY